MKFYSHGGCTSIGTAPEGQITSQCFACQNSNEPDISSRTIVSNILCFREHQSGFILLQGLKWPRAMQLEAWLCCRELSMVNSCQLHTRCSCQLSLPLFYRVSYLPTYQHLHISIGIQYAINHEPQHVDIRLSENGSMRRETYAGHDSCGDLGSYLSIHFSRDMGQPVPTPLYSSTACRPPLLLSNRWRHGPSETGIWAIQEA